MSAPAASFMISTGSIGSRKVTKAYSGRVKDLTSCSLPDRASSELTAVELAPKQTDAVSGVRKRHAAADKHEQHNERKAHCEVDHLPSGCNTFGQTDPWQIPRLAEALQRATGITQGDMLLAPLSSSTYKP